MAVDLEGQEDAGARDVSDLRQEWHEARATIIGATDSPKILGLSKYGTALTVYNDKVNPDTSDRQMSLPAWLGLKMQATVGELYTTATGTRLRADNLMHRMPGYGYIGCHLDFRALGKPRLLVECKTRAYMKGWGEDGSADIPVEVWVQVQHEMMVVGAEQAHVAVLFGHHTYRTYVIEPNPEFQSGLLEKLVEFHDENWIPLVPPLPTGHPLDTEIVKERNPDDPTDEIRAILPEQYPLIERYRLARTNAAQASAAEAEAKNRIRDIIADAAGITGPWGTITLKKTRPTREVTWALVAGAYRKIIETILPKAGADADAMDRAFSDNFGTTSLDDIESLYTVEKPGYRRFHVEFTEEESE